MKLLIVFDDMTADMLENQPIVLELLSEAKKMNTSLALD